MSKKGISISELQTRINIAYGLANRGIDIIEDVIRTGIDHCILCDCRTCRNFWKKESKKVKKNENDSALRSREMPILGEG